MAERDQQALEEEFRRASNMSEFSGPLAKNGPTKPTDRSNGSFQTVVRSPEHTEEPLKPDSKGKGKGKETKLPFFPANPIDLMDQWHNLAGVGPRVRTLSPSPIRLAIPSPLPSSLSNDSSSDSGNGTRRGGGGGGGDSFSSSSSSSSPLSLEDSDSDSDSDSNDSSDDDRKKRRKKRDKNKNEKDKEKRKEKFKKKDSKFRWKRFDFLLDKENYLKGLKNWEFWKNALNLSKAHFIPNGLEDQYNQPSKKYQAGYSATVDQSEMREIMELFDRAIKQKATPKGVATEGAAPKGALIPKDTGSTGTSKKLPGNPAIDKPRAMIPQLYNSLNVKDRKLMIVIGGGPVQAKKIGIVNWDLKGPKGEYVEPIVCEACDRAKITKIPSKDLQERGTHVGKLFWYDVGQIKPVIIDGNAYYSLIIDDVSRHRVFKVYKTKDEVQQHLCSYITNVKTRLALDNKTVKTFRIDGGREFGMSLFESFCNTERVELINSSPYNQYQNGVPERSIRIIQDSARVTVVQIRQSTIEDVTPQECYNRALGSKDNTNNLKPDNAHLRIIGSRCTVLIDENHRIKAEKLKAQRAKGLFLGYQGTHNYKIDDETITVKRKRNRPKKVKPKLYEYEAPNEDPEIMKALIQEGINHHPGVHNFNFVNDSEDDFFYKVPDNHELPIRQAHESAVRQAYELVHIRNVCDPFLLNVDGDGPSLKEAMESPEWDM
ncbi:hypothetical protein DL768_002957 [Monosporascus sp. mg162]|nr:hypothetical protein DL768_002957 [Monosporascus sp. mg162]